MTSSSNLAARRPSVGIVLVFLSNVCFGTTGPAGKAVMGAGLSPLHVVQLRISGAAVALLLIALARDPKSLRMTRRDLPLLLAYGLIGFLGVQSLYFVAMSRLPVGVALLLEYLAIVLVALWAKFVQKRALARTTWIGMVLTVVGLALIEQVWRGLVLDAVGGIAGLGAAVCLAGYFLLSERGLGGRDPIALAAWGASVGAMAAAVISPPWQIPLARLRETAQLGPLTTPAWVALLYVILIGTVAAYLSGIAALRHLSSPVVGILSTFEVVVAAGTAWLLLGERLNAVELTGALILFTGVVLAQVGSNPPTTVKTAAANSSQPRRSTTASSSSTPRRSRDDAVSTLR